MRLTIITRTERHINWMMASPPLLSKELPDKARILLSQRQLIVDLDSTTGGNSVFTRYGVMNDFPNGIPVNSHAPLLPCRQLIEVDPIP